jgi:hypothetical protein
MQNVSAERYCRASAARRSPYLQRIGWFEQGIGWQTYCRDTQLSCASNLAGLQVVMLMGEDFPWKVPHRPRASQLVKLKPKLPRGSDVGDASFWWMTTTTRAPPFVKPSRRLVTW